MVWILVCCHLTPVLHTCLCHERIFRSRCLFELDGTSRIILAQIGHQTVCSDPRSVFNQWTAMNRMKLIQSWGSGIENRSHHCSWRLAMTMEHKLCLNWQAHVLRKSFIVNPLSPLPTCTCSMVDSFDIIRNSLTNELTTYLTSLIDSSS